jgi:hypothetical protein
MMFSAKARAIASLEFAHDNLLEMLGDFPAERYTAQLPGAPNHALWTIGHLATGYVWFGGAAGVAMPALPGSYNELFGYGSKPVGDAMHYPAMAEVRGYCDKAFDALVDGVKRLTDAELAAPPAVDTGGFAKDRLDAVEKAAWHEGWHAGQIAMLRRALGLGKA